MVFILSSNPDSLRAALSKYARTVTIEAEYGDEVVEGTALTMAHHGPRAGQKAPCAYENGCVEEVDAVGLSHLDLDALGGCLAVLNKKSGPTSFWRLAEYVDLNGAHQIQKAVWSVGATIADLTALFAWWAWNRENRFLPPRDGVSEDVTAAITRDGAVLLRILEGDQGLLSAGKKFAAKEAVLNIESLVCAVTCSGGQILLLRAAGTFVNHLYATPEGVAADAIVGLNLTTGAVTLSFPNDASRPPGWDARALVQEIWGPRAGGHANIAGSPRDLGLTQGDAELLLALLQDKYEAK